MKYKIEVLQSLSESAIQQWNDLWEHSSYANYTNSPQWFLSVLETFGYKDFVIVSIYEKSRLVATGALIKEKKYGVDCYTVAPGNFTSGMPFLIDIKNSSVIKIFTKCLLELGPVFLDNIPGEFVTSLKKNTDEIYSAFQALNYYLPIIKEKDERALIINRKVLAKRIRDIEENFNLKSFDGTEPESLKIAYQIDEKSRKQNNGYSTFSDQKIKDLFISFARHFMKNVQINILYFKDIPIAYEIGFLIGSTYFANQIAYDGEYMRYSPGKVMALRLIDNLASRNVTKFDFGSGDNHIKRLLTNEYMPLYQVIFSPNKIMRSYLSISAGLKNYLFDKLNKHMKIYSLYKKIMKGSFKR